MKTLREVIEEAKESINKRAEVINEIIVDTGWNAYFYKSFDEIVKDDLLESECYDSFVGTYAIFFVET